MMSGFYASEQAVLSLYAVGRISGCTVDIGHGKIGKICVVLNKADMAVAAAGLGAHIGPEPTTDRFLVVMSGPDAENTCRTTFGGAFLSKFECSQMPHLLL